jgi:hypothetical protein
MADGVVMKFRQSEPFIGDRDHGAGRIPTWRFDFAGLTPRQRIEAWNEACRGFSDVTMDVEMVARTKAAFSWHRLDGLMFSSGLSFPHVARRNVGHVG